MFESVLSQGIGGIILTILALVVIAIFGGALYSFVLVIFKFIFSGGRSDVVREASGIALYTAIGLMLLVVLLVIIPFVFQYLNVTGYSMYSARSILDRAGELIQYVTGY